MTNRLLQRLVTLPGHSAALMLGTALVLSALVGCANYRQNAPLYHQNVVLQNQNSALQSTIRRQNITIAELRSQLAAKTPRIATLPPHRLSELFTVSAVHITSDTSAAHLRNAKAFNGFRVFVRTLMPGNMVLPATGTFTIEAFDLGIKHGSQRLGEWVFTPEQVKKLWYGNLGLNEFCFDCPWKKPPTHQQITFHVTFHDSLTGQTFTDQRVITIKD